MKPTHIWFAPLLAATLALALVACHEDTEQPVDADAAPITDAGADGDALPDRAPAPPDVFVDAAVDPPGCVGDGDCGERAYCGPEGACVPAVAERVFDWPTDGLTRAAAAGFELAPPYLEPWEDRAGPDCPHNRPGLFDGRLDDPAPEDPCQDRFTDADDDGRFDAVWLGGLGVDRPATGLEQRRPPAGRVLLLTRDAAVHLLVTLDVHALDQSRHDALVDRLVRRLGLPDSNIAIHATGTRTGPDAVGLCGPSLAIAADPAGRALAAAGWLGVIGDLPYRSGVDPAWWDALAPAIAAAARHAAADLRPVAVRAAAATLPLPRALTAAGPLVVPDADADGVENDADDLAAWRTEPGLIARDERLPATVDPTLRIVALDAIDTGAPRVVIAGWSAAPAAAAATNRLDADHPGAARAALEAAYPGSVAVWLTAAAADTFRAGGHVPALAADGAMIDADGAPVEDPAAAAPAADPADALGRLIAARLVDALADAELRPAALTIERRYAWVPLESPRLAAAAHLGLLPHLRDRLRGRVQSAAWVDPQMVPACGGLGCLRYRLDRIELAPGVTLLTVPGALDRAYVDGRPAARLTIGDGRNLTDLDFDGVPDADDEQLRFDAQSGGALVTVALPGPANPQRFPALDGLGRTGAWIIGRTGGGLGSLRTPVEQPPVFEGQLAPLDALAAVDLALCGLYPCASDLTLAALAERLRAAQPARLADLPGSRELRLVAAAPPAPDPQPWQITTPDGALRARGDSMQLGPRDRAYAADGELVAAGVEPGDLLELPALDLAVEIAEVVPVIVRRHPNAGDAWRSSAPGGGDIVYNTACELLYAGSCPDRRPVQDDPNSALPRTP
ncbi:MAG: hypothetical protein H6701_01440 [Myxococcales bacterium]|nr:hypothetical protein [Myxococcales bacterium]